MESIVYFVVAESVRRVKIGTTTDVRRRMELLRVHSPIDLRLAAFVKGDRQVEADFHEMFGADRLHGEWFTLSRDILRTIERIASGNWTPAWRPECSRSGEAAKITLRHLELLFGDGWKSRAASELGVSSRTIKRWIDGAADGRFPFSPATMEKISRATTVKLSALDMWIRRLSAGADAPQ